MSRRRVMAALLLAGAGLVRAQPPPMTAKGCCCVVAGVAYRCSEKTQADCLAVQPGAPVFPKIADWKKAWDAYVAALEAQGNKTSFGGWVGESLWGDIHTVAGGDGGATRGGR